MRVLVTRPPDQAARTAREVFARGHEPVIAPVLDIGATGAALPKGDFDLVLATSARAFTFLRDVESLKGLALACVGEKTAQAGLRAGLVPVHVAPDVETLARTLLAEGPRKTLYLAGEERRPLLETLLGDAGWRIETLETYAARPVADWRMPDAIDAVLHYSPRSAALALDLMGADAAAGLRHYCLSEAVATVVRARLEGARIFIASQRDEKSLLTLLD